MTYLALSRKAQVLHLGYCQNCSERTVLGDLRLTIKLNQLR